MDTNIDFFLAYPQAKIENWLLWKVLKLTALRPEFHFVSTITVPESLIRSKNKFEPYPDSPETLKKRLNFDQKLLKRFKSIQYSINYKKKKSDFIIKNNFTKKSVNDGIKSILKKLDK